MFLAVTIMSRFSWSNDSNELLQDFGLLEYDPVSSRVGGYYTETKKAKILFGKEKSLIDWDQLEEDDYLNFRQWQIDKDAESQVRDVNYFVRRKSLKETMGKIIHCIGVCRVYRGGGHFDSQYRSKIKEEDELVTHKNSFAWIYLMDGTLVRLSPNSSITFREINIGHKEIFLHARVNVGNITWISRLRELMKVKKRRETDSIFLPLPLGEANLKISPPVLKENKLFKSVAFRPDYADQYKKLNSMILKNNLLASNKKVISFLVLPNGSLLGKDLFLDIMVEFVGKSFIKLNSFKDHNVVNDKSWDPVKFYYRGYVNKKNFEILRGKWYKVGSRGRDIQ